MHDLYYQKNKASSTGKLIFFAFPTFQVGTRFKKSRPVFNNKSNQWYPWDAYSYAENALSWIVVKELMEGKGFTNGNPFEYAVELCKRGFLPLGPVQRQIGLFKGTHVQEFVVI